MLAEYPPARVAAITGVRRPVIERLAEAIGTVKPATICAGFGMQRYTNSRPGDARDHRAAGAHRQHRPAGRRLGVRQPAEPRLRDAAGPARLLPAGARRGRRSASRSRRRGSAPTCSRSATRRCAWRGSSAATRSRRSRRPAQVLRASALARLPRRRRPVPHRHGARGGRRPAGEDDVRADRRHRRVLAPLPPAQAEGDRAARRGAGRSPRCTGALAERLGFPRDAMDARLVPPGDAAVEAYLDAAARAVPRADARAPARGAGPGAGRRGGGVRRPRLPDAVGADRAASRARRPRAGASTSCRAGEPPVGVAVGERCPAAAADAQHQGPHPLAVRQPAVDPRARPRPRCCRSRPGGRARRAASPTATAPASSTSAAASSSQREHRPRRCGAGAPSSHNGWWMQEGGGVNLLSCARETDMAHGAAFHDNAVEVERA